MKNWKQLVWTNKSAELAKDYSTYQFTGKERCLVVLEGTVLLLMIGHCFYDSLFASVCMSPGLVWFMKYQKEKYRIRRKHTLRGQFKDAVLAVAANQKAGYSVENAFKEAYTDMRLLYGEGSLICEELLYLIRGIHNNVTIEKLLLSLGERSGIQDIREFGEVFSIAKRSGGNLSRVIEMTAASIEEKINVEQEIQVMISAKKMEANVMSVVPFLIILYLDTTSAGFFDVLYHNPVGIVVMSVCLVVYLVAVLLMQKLMEINV